MDVRVSVFGVVLLLLTATAAQQTTGNNFIFNAGTCYSSDCRCFECCSEESTDSVFQDAYVPPAPANNSDLPMQYIGAGEDFNLANCDRCDHANDSTAIFLKKFDYDGDLKWCKWYIQYDCSDTVLPGGSNVRRQDAFPNRLLRFGIFDRDDSRPYAFKLIGYITLTRAQWYGNLLNDGVLPLNDGAQFQYVFTLKDKKAMKVETGSLKDKYIGFSWSVGGAVCYQKPLASFSSGPEMMAIFDLPTEFGLWDQIDLSTHTYIETIVKPKQLRRYYNMRCAYKPYSM